MTPRTHLVRLAAAAALVAAPLGAQSHVYTLNGSFADALGGPSLVQVGTLTSTTVGSAQGYRFDAGEGLSLSGALANPSVYSIELRFLFDATSGYRKIIDTRNRTQDQGFYNQGTAAVYYPVASGAAGAIPTGSLVTAVLTRDAAGTVVGYVNGVSQFTFNDAVGQLATFTGPSNIIQFLRDDAVQNSEQSSGFVDYIRIYDKALTGAQVANLTAPTSAVPEPATVALVATGLVAVAGVARRRRQG